MPKQVVIVEPFYSGSHKKWTDSVVQLFRQAGEQVFLITLPGRHWKWRMFGAANYLAEEFLEFDVNPDVLLVSDMLDLAVFEGMTRSKLVGTKTVVYFHENQLTYPWSPTDQDVKLQRDQSYGLINMRTAICADEVLFNSSYHKASFISAIEKFVKQFPDAVRKEWSSQIEKKSTVLYLGMDVLELSNESKEVLDLPVLLWNHRWEYDKNPEAFYQALKNLKADGCHFQLIVCGERTNKYPEVFDQIKAEFSEELIHFGYAADRAEYKELLLKANVLPVTSNQDFFGGSVVEGIAAGCIPVLPNRLAYPEHLPEKFRATYLAEDQEKWYQLLKNVIQNFAYHRTNASELRKYVSRYDWTEQSSKYLEILK